MKSELKIAKNVITEEIEKFSLKVKKIILFGSRARGEFNKDSDWDFLVIVDQKIDFAQKQKINLRIRRRLIQFDMSTDIVIQSETDLNERKTNPGFLSYYALKEGIVL